MENNTSDNMSFQQFWTAKGKSDSRDGKPMVFTPRAKYSTVENALAKDCYEAAYKYWSWEN